MHCESSLGPSCIRRICRHSFTASRYKSVLWIVPDALVGQPERFFRQRSWSVSWDLTNASGMGKDKCVHRSWSLNLWVWCIFSHVNFWIGRLNPWNRRVNSLASGVIVPEKQWLWSCRLVLISHDDTMTDDFQESKRLNGWDWKLETCRSQEAVKGNKLRQGLNSFSVKTQIEGHPHPSRQRLKSASRTPFLEPWDG